MRNQNNKISEEILHLKIIMEKAEIGYKELKTFFFALSVLTFLAGISQAMFRSYIYSEKFQTGDQLTDIFYNTLYECGWKIVALVPTIILIFLFRHQIKSTNKSISLWIFDLISFVLIICGSLLPVVSITLGSDFDPADFFIIVSSALCMLLIGIFTDNPQLKLSSCIYLFIPAILLSVLSLVHKYNEFSNMLYASVSFITAYSYTKSFLFYIYPCLGYLFTALKITAKETV